MAAAIDDRRLFPASVQRDRAAADDVQHAIAIVGNLTGHGRSGADALTDLTQLSI